MGNARSKSASVHQNRSQDKPKFLFQKAYSPMFSKNLSNFPSKNTIKTTSKTETKTTIPQTENLSQIISKNNVSRFSLKEIKESINNCCKISECNFLTLPNMCFSQNSSLLLTKEKLPILTKEFKYFNKISFNCREEDNENIKKKYSIERTPRNSKKGKEFSNNINERSINDLSCDIKKNSQIGSFVKETPKLQNKDTSSPNEDGSTPHFDKKSDFSQNSQTKLEITQTIALDLEKNPKEDHKNKFEMLNFGNNSQNIRENQGTLKEKLSHILKTNLNKSINSDNSLKISGILDASNEEPHYIHLNLEDFLKGTDIEKNENILSRANLDKLNKMNERKITVTNKNRKKNNKAGENLNHKDLNRKKNNNNLHSSRQGTLRSYKNEENFEVFRVGSKIHLPNHAYQPKKNILIHDKENVLKARKIN